MERYVNDRMGYSLKDLWNLKVDSVIYAGRPRQQDTHIKMSRTGHKKQLRARERAVRKDYKLAKSVMAKVEKERHANDKDSKV